MTSLSVSKFTAAYQFYWSEMFPDTKLLYPPTFDGRCVLYPNLQLVSWGSKKFDFSLKVQNLTPILRDYISWRQVDCHINNLYNTTFHKLVQIKGMTPAEAEKALSKTLSKDKVSRVEILRLSKIA